MVTKGQFLQKKNLKIFIILITVFTLTASFIDVNYFFHIWSKITSDKVTPQFPGSLTESNVISEISS